jgi:hypothetical protein
MQKKTSGKILRLKCRDGKLEITRELKPSVKERFIKAIFSNWITSGSTEEVRSITYQLK